MFRCFFKNSLELSENLGGTENMPTHSLINSFESSKSPPLVSSGSTVKETKWSENSMTFCQTQISRMVT